MKFCDFLVFAVSSQKMKKRRKPLILLKFPAEFLCLYDEIAQ